MTKNLIVQFFSPLQNIDHKCFFWKEYKEYSLFLLAENFLKNKFDQRSLSPPPPPQLLTVWLLKNFSVASLILLDGPGASYWSICAVPDSHYFLQFHFPSNQPTKIINSYMGFSTFNFHLKKNTPLNTFFKSVIKFKSVQV